MTWYTFDSVPAYDEPSGGIARNSVGQVYALTDTAHATPLPVVDLAGVPLASLLTSNQGFIPSFKVEDRLEVVWVSGPYEIPLLSQSGVIELAEASAASSASSAAAAQEAADRSALPPAGAFGTVLTTGSTGPEWLPPTGGTGTGIVGAPSVWPTEFPPSGHSHLLGELRRGSDLPLVAAVLNLLAAADPAAARAAIGAGTGDGTSNLTIGTSGTTAMAGNRTFKAAEIGVVTGTGLVATNVQAALTELKTLIGSGGSGATLDGTIVERRYTAGAYPVRGSTLPLDGTVVVEWVGPVMPTLGGAYAVVGVDRFAATAA